MKHTPLEQKLADIFIPVVEDLGYRLIQVRVTGTQQHGQTVQVMVDTQEKRRMLLDECAKVSRDLSALMDVEDPIKGRYRLEVSTPGIDRPLVSLEDFDQYRGCDVKIEINPPAESGQKRFEGIIKTVNGDTVTLETDTDMVSFDFDRIEKAKLVLTDALIEATKHMYDDTAQESA